METQFYIVSGFCFNCGYRENVSVTRGQLRPDKVMCEGCGCLTLEPQAFVQSKSIINPWARRSGDKAH